MERLKILRTKRKLLQKEVASALNIGRTTYVKYENGDSEPSLSILIELANFFDVTTDYLLERSNIPNQKENQNPELKISEQEKTLLENFRSTTEHGRQRIIQTTLNICDEIEKKDTERNTKASS